MPGNRMLMRPWLEMQINQNKIPGLQWISKDEHIFQIPWKHAARHGWEVEKDACLFQQWAMHTGRYKVGEKKTDAKTWKANFRCALNSLQDIEELKDRSVNKGSSAVRVYRMLPAVTKPERKERKSRVAKKKTINTDCEDNSLECRLGSTRSDSIDNHSTYTDHSYSEQDLEVNSTGLSPDLVTYEVGNSAELRHIVEISFADSTNQLYPFQVSPESSYMSDGEEADAITDDILEMMETSIWQLDEKGYLSNETGKPFTDHSSRHSSPESDKVTGEIELRFSTDLTDGDINLGNWLDHECLNYASTICTF